MKKVTRSTTAAETRDENCVFPPASPFTRVLELCSVGSEAESRRDRAYLDVDPKAVIVPGMHEIA